MSGLRVIALSGGVGGAKLALGLDRVLAPAELLVIANSADDFEHLGLHISPDIDTLLYTLGGRANPETGWGRAAESWSFMTALGELGGPPWFRLGDKDLAVHVLRTARLRAGASLSEVTRELATAFALATPIIPMSDERVRTRVCTETGWLDFQEYFVRERCRPPVRELEYVGAESAEAAPGLAAALRERKLAAIIICPSNPYLSIAPILAVRALRQGLIDAVAPIIAISPIVGGRALKGPTAKIMTELGLECSVANVARHYAGLIDGLVIDEADRAAAAAIESLGIAVCVTGTIMRSLEERCDLARQTLKFAERLRGAAPKSSGHVGATAR